MSHEFATSPDKHVSSMFWLAIILSIQNVLKIFNFALSITDYKENLLLSSITIKISNFGHFSWPSKFNYFSSVALLLLYNFVYFDNWFSHT